MFLISLSSLAQTSLFNGWLALFHKQRLAPNIFLLSDIQFRTAADLKYMATILPRTAVSFQLNKQNAVGVGYAKPFDWREENGRRVSDDENRIFEQYLREQKAGTKEMTGRLRLEQRFTGPRHDRSFSQRTRVLLGVLLPLVQRRPFTRGPYANLQNEIFLNVQHREKTNNHFFDQNRLFASVGYRVSPHFRTEIGYMYRRRQNRLDYTNHQILQLQVNTSL